jgi:hypothetical protein
LYACNRCAFEGTCLSVALSCFCDCWDKPLWLSAGSSSRAIRWLVLIAAVLFIGMIVMSVELYLFAKDEEAVSTKVSFEVDAANIVATIQAGVTRLWSGRRTIVSCFILVR